LIVVDSSVVTAAVADDHVGAFAVASIAHSSLFAPHLIDLEVLNAIRRANRRGTIDDIRALEALENLELIRISRVPHTQLAERIWELRHNLTPYDASYVALAELLEAPLITIDSRLAKATGPTCEINLLDLHRPTN
jgi:predicted nucleic acid-binding protein